ncbi:CoB--CoM heterodisulfide reductase iron-sulfur subunit A family protein [Shumkonia mesophila]|uniref:CoB--CoM heterodisulfide reductase iron-sulfur subunit A family protein n=1 Tax=Shumkonia mesophila TaxID=2838854 RepID=UPI0029349867|nr:CoB--CoM heterodisulfide reductase iron-sulfur subunit A family protein [Shumkonia mesophila]
MTAEDSKKKPAGDEKVAVYICHCGGNISDHVDVEALERMAAEMPGVTVSRRNHFMCSDPGQNMIIEDLKAGRADRIVVASCSPALHETTFRRAAQRAGVNPYLYEHANIREQVSWVHHGDGATAKAAALVGAAVAKARALQPLEPIRVEAIRHATVIGGGIAGLKAARDLAIRGVKVALIEKTPFLGGNFAKLDRVYPTQEKAGDLLAGLAATVLAHPSITVITCAEMVASEGYVGDFKLKVKRRPPESAEDIDKLARLKEAGVAKGAFVPFVGILPFDVPQAEETVDLATGAVVLATGFKHYTPPRGMYGYGDNPEVITLPDLIKLMAEDAGGGGTLKVNGRPVKTMAMIRCVGSRQIPGIHEPDEKGNLNEYCSRVCCTATLQADRELREKYPETVIYDFYRDIRAYGRGHEEYYVGASRDGVLFVRFEADAAPAVARTPEGSENPLAITAKDTLLSGQDVEIPVDLVVLAVGMVPSDVSSIVDIMKLPIGADRFLLEVHPKLRPVELATTGILLAGTCQAPMDSTEAAEGATAASVKAATILSRGFVELDPYVATVDANLCTGTGACAETCPHPGCITLTDAANGKGRTAKVNPALCTGCGMCVAVCPNIAIEVNGWTLRQYEAMVDAIVGEPIVAEAE